MFYFLLTFIMDLNFVLMFLKQSAVMPYSEHTKKTFYYMFTLSCSHCPARCAAAANEISKSVHFQETFSLSDIWQYCMYLCVFVSLFACSTLIVNKERCTLCSTLQFERCSSHGQMTTSRAVTSAVSSIDNYNSMHFGLASLLHEKNNNVPMLPRSLLRQCF